MNKHKRALLPIHDIGEFHVFRDGQQEILLAERVSDYTLDDLPKAFVLHDCGVYSVFSQDSDYPTIYYDRTASTPYILHVQLYPDYFPNNTGIFYNLGTQQLVAILDDGEYDTLAFGYGEGVTDVEPGVAMSTKYAEWLISTHHNFGLDVQLPTTVLKQARHFQLAWRVFEQDQVV